MNSALLTNEGNEAFLSLHPAIRRVLVAINDLQFDQASDQTKEILDTISNLKRNGTATSEAYLNDVFVLDRYADFLNHYIQFWSKIIAHKFRDSWGALQDSLHMLRLIKRFSTLDTYFFELQLLELEGLYPYNVFCSIGMAVEWFECSVCGKDMDSMDCPHIQGHLYAGQMAQAIGRNVASIDHIALVTNPADKRCVIAYEDSAEQFRFVRFLSGGLSSRQYSPLDFSELRYSKRRVRNPSYVRQGRNQPCLCKSGKKFKKCCAFKEYIEKDHVDIVFKPNNFQKMLLAGQHEP